MKDGYFFRKTYRIKNDLAIFFKRYKVAIILLLCFFVLGLVTGIFTSSRYSGDLELNNIPDENIVSFLLGDKGSFGLFFSYFIGLTIAILLIIFLNINVFFKILNFAYVLVRGYILGFTIFSFISLFSLAGIINVIIIIIPFGLIINFLIILISAICISKNNVIKRYGKQCYLDNSPNNFLLLISLILVALLFLECMFMPVIKITIIVN